MTETRRPTLQSTHEFALDALRQIADARLNGAQTPEDIAATVCYAADAPSLTGQTIRVDAGQHLLPARRDVAFSSEPG